MAILSLVLLFAAWNCDDASALLGSWQNQPLKKAVYIMECLTRLMHALALFWAWPVLNPMCTLCTLRWGHAHHPTCTPGAHSRLHLHLNSYDKCLLRQNSATIEKRLWFWCIFLGCVLFGSPPLDYATFSDHLVQKSSKSTKANPQLLSSTCPHDMVSKGLRRSFFLDFFDPHVNMTWSPKGFEGPSFWIIRSFYRQRVLMAL
jgi:hypothetical protein